MEKDIQETQFYKNVSYFLKPFTVYQINAIFFLYSFVLDRHKQISMLKWKSLELSFELIINFFST